MAVGSLVSESSPANPIDAHDYGVAVQARTKLCWPSLFWFFDSHSLRNAHNELSQSTIRALVAHRWKSVGGTQSWDMVSPTEAGAPGTWATRSPPLDSRCLASLAGRLEPESHDASVRAPWFGAYREPSRHIANSTPASLRATATVAMNLPRRCSMAVAQIEIGSSGRVRRRFQAA